MTSETVIQRWALALGLPALVLSWLIPNHYPPWTSLYNESAAAIGLTALAVANCRALLACRAPGSAWVLVACTAIPLMQWWTGLLSFSGDAWVGTLYLLGLAMSIAVGSAWATQSGAGASAALATVLNAAAAVSSALALGQAAGVNALGIWSLDAVPGMRPYANLGQPNNLATLMGLGAASVLLLRAQRRLGVLASVLLTAIFVLGAAATQSRTALLFGPLLLAGCLVSRRRGVTLHVSAWVVAAFCLAHFVLTWLWPTLQLSFNESAQTSLAERGIGSLRLQIWPLLLDAIRQQTLFGYGWLQVGAAELAVAEHHPPVGELWLHGHNVLLELVIWCGVPLGLVLCAALLYWCANRWWRVATAEAVCGMLAVSIVGTHAMLELPHHYAYFLIPVGIWAGVVESTLPSWRPIAARWIVLPTLVGIVLLAAVWKDYPAIEEDFRSVRFEGLGIGSSRVAASAPSAPFLSSLTAFLHFARTEPHRGMSDAELGCMESLVKRYPYAQSLYRYGVALALNGRPLEAKQQFVRMRHIHGEELYARLRGQLADSASRTELEALLQSLPE